MIWYILAAATTFPLLILLQMRSARSYLIRCVQHRVVPFGPGTEARLFTGTLEALRRHGFGPPQWVAAPYSLVTPSEHTDYSVFTQHPEGFWARVQLSPLPNARYPISMALLSLRRSAPTSAPEILLTTDRWHQTPWPESPNTNILRSHKTGIEHLLSVHTRRFIAAHRCTLDELLQAIDSDAAQAHRVARSNGELVDYGQHPSVYRATWRGAFRMLLSGLRQTQRRQTSTEPLLKIEHQPELVQVWGEALERYCRRVRPERERRRSVVLAGTSLLAATVSFAWWFPLWQVALFIGVLLFHELGHLIAMRATGHSEASIYFLPFFGAAVVSQKRDSSSQERVFAALMGPLPGLILALTAVPWVLDGTLLDSSTLSLGWTLLIVINWLNLLPVLPLDGGHILNLLLFSRYPALESTFRILSCSCLLIAGVWLEQAVLVVAFIASLAVTAGQHRVASLTRDLRNNPPPDGTSRFITYARYLLLRHGTSLQFPAALAVVESTEWRRNQHPMSPRRTLSFLALYVTAFILPPCLWWFAIHS